jgi:cold shock CspA family protein
MCGTITIVHDEKGFGYITGDDGCDYYFHRTALRGLWFDEGELRGLVVQFSLRRTGRRMAAHAVKPLFTGR